MCLCLKTFKLLMTGIQQTAYTTVDNNLAIGAFKSNLCAMIQAYELVSKIAGL